MSPRGHREERGLPDGKMLVALPFMGFSGTLHGHAIDASEEDLFLSPRGEVYADLLEEHKKNVQVDFSRIFEQYARSYCEAFRDWFGALPSMRFESLDPVSDGRDARIFVTVDRAEAERLLAATPRSALKRTAESFFFQDRPGHMSFYSPNVAAWGRFEGWDHNHVQMLIRASVLARGEQAAKKLGEQWLGEQRDGPFGLEAFEERFSERVRETDDLDRAWLEAPGREDPESKAVFDRLMGEVEARRTAEARLQEAAPA